ncbi:MAG TPA: PIG-L family deacetylase [Actinomycetota bacterium]|nr:PIG-L family deacetylase [Actinomycetota bacterium]
MATLVTFHAHPDDEAIACGGTIVKAVRDGHRVVLVVATKGENGEVDDGFLDPEETLWERRVLETEAAAKILGIHRVEFLGYFDSGMMGTPQNDEPGSFWTADVEAAAQKLAEILREENADILTVYDDNGSYGHPDHIQVHRVGIRAAELAGTPKVFEVVIDKDELTRSMEKMAEMGMGLSDDMDISNMGVPSEVITTRVDAKPFLDVKRAAMAAHASQISETSFFLAMLPKYFEEAFGTEPYVLRGAPDGFTSNDLFSP